MIPSLSRKKLLDVGVLTDAEMIYHGVHGDHEEEN
jgi:hypothetical protein